MTTEEKLTKTVTPQVLEDYHNQKVAPYLNSVLSINHFDKANLYSKSEKLIGQWIDGRPLYQKTINFGVLPNNTTKSVSTGLTSVSVKDMKMYAYRGSDGTSTLNSFMSLNTLGSNYAIKIRNNGAQIEIYTIDDLSAFGECYITIQYTKTTDSSSSVSYADANNYSTSEQIIGTWIDGKTLYQKTIQGTMPETSADGVAVTKDISIGASIDTFVDSVAIVKTTSISYLLSITMDGIRSNNYLTANIGAFYTLRHNNATSPNTIHIASSKQSLNNQLIYVTLKYTKTT